MQSSDRLTFGIAAVIILGLVVLAWRMWSYQPPTENSFLKAATTTTAAFDPSSLSLYSSGEFGVSFFYPAAATLISSSDPDTVTLLEAGDTRLGIRVVTTSAGIHSSAQERCVSAGPAESTVGTRIVSGVTWYGFARTALGTEQERAILAYRAYVGGRCILIEESQPISTADAPSFIAIIVDGLTVADSTD